MKKFHHNLFPFSFFLSSKTNVSDLESAAIEYGGATKNLITNEVWSNVAGGDYIYIKPKNNIFSVFVPDTINVNENASELQRNVLKHVRSKIKNKYGTNIIRMEDALGSWYSTDKQEVVYDNIIIVTIKINKANREDIEFFIKLADYIKQKMKQEGVSIMINDALGIV